MHPDSTATFGFQFGQVLVLATEVFLYDAIEWSNRANFDLGYLEAMLVLSLIEGNVQITSLHLAFNLDGYFLQ